MSAAARASVEDEPVVLVTGGAGFIGSNLAHRLLSSGRRVVLLDDLSRPSVERNAAWLAEIFPGRVELRVADVRDAAAVAAEVARASEVFHFAAQTAVTTSVARPLHDFDVNARGTLNVLEALRAQRQPPPLVFTSTNKVYGALDDVALRAYGRRYEPEAELMARRGISETRPLDLHSPYGCSKGAADQYVLDYARTYGIPAVVFRMSCIYGPRQFGTEDQGWLAHFAIRALSRRPITIYGDGLQVRDVLYVDDLVGALLAAQRDMAKLTGRAFNIGGGPESTLSLLELLDLIAELGGRRPESTHAPWRVGDQRYYVSDFRRFAGLTGWAPRVGVREGVARLYRWLDAAGVPPDGGKRGEVRS